MQLKVLWSCFTLLLFYSIVKAQISNINFSSSNLPIVMITTDSGATIVDEPKVMAHMGIIYNGESARNNITDPFNHYDGKIGIEHRGNASLRISDKKPFTFETRNEDGTDVNVEILGLPRENDFILRAAYIDKTLMRDPLSFYMARSMGRWAPRTRHIELILNNSYEGVYILVEKIKPDRNRLDIVRMDSTDVAGDDVTGGYIWSVQQSDSNDVVFDPNEGDGNDRVLKYPKGDKVTPEQLSYIRDYEESFSRAMEGPSYNDPNIGYPAYLDLSTFVDEVIYQEATSNSDAYGWSSYFYKDRLGKMSSGPAWDFDQALTNSSYNDGYRIDKWVIEQSDWARPRFWDRLWNDPDFKKQLVHKWAEYRLVTLRTDRLFAFIDSVANYLEEAQEHNFTRWPILGVRIWRSPPYAEQRDTYQKEIDYMKDWFEAHLIWMDEQLDPAVTGIMENERPYSTLQKFFLRQNFPNPFNPKTVIHYALPENLPVNMELFDMDGKRIKVLVDAQKPAGYYAVQFNAGSLASGVYLYRIQAGSFVQTRKMLLMK